MCQQKQRWSGWRHSAGCSHDFIRKPNWGLIKSRDRKPHWCSASLIRVCSAEFAAVSTALSLMQSADKKPTCECVCVSECNHTYTFRKAACYAAASLPFLDPSILNLFTFFIFSSNLWVKRKKDKQAIKSHTPPPFIPPSHFGFSPFPICPSLTGSGCISRVKTSWWN